jgi:hypothetical protein
VVSQSDQQWDSCVQRIDALFADATRPDHFTNYTHCCECSDSDDFFQGHTPETLAALMNPPETLPYAFLTEQAFHYYMPAFIRMLARTGEDYCVGEILFFLENRLDTFTNEQRSAIRDALYLVYERSQAQIHSSLWDYETIWRILNRLDEAPTD